MLNFINKLLKPSGFSLVKKSGLDTADMEPEFLEFFRLCSPFSMTSLERMYGLFKAIEYLEKNQIQGDFVECGVWKGGSSMLAISSFLHFNNTSRKIYMYDTFEGMSEPTEKDVSVRGEEVSGNWENLKQENERVFCYSTLDEVRNNIKTIGYPENRIHFVKGKVEDTIPQNSPDKISILRLDTDWFESTKHELIHLYPKLVPGGVLIIDDYGHWKGAREAVDNYFAENNLFPFLGRLDYTGRIMIKSWGNISK